MSTKLETLLAIALATVVFAPAAAVSARRANDLMTSPPANFKKVSSLVKLPDFVPGLGVLYVDPSTLPDGPFLGYDKQGNLVNVTYMVPLSQLEQHKNLTDLGDKLGGVKVDHTDIEFNPGHPGVQEGHYHIVEWLISRQDEASRMK